MVYKLNIIIFCLFIVRISGDSETFKAAVVEYSPDVKKFTPIEDIFKQSVSDYISYIEEAASKGVDIIVFPECGLTTLKIPNRGKVIDYATKVPSADENISPCDSDTEYISHVLKALSCSAKKNNIYVVVNLPEVDRCKGRDECPSDNALFYNTNVVFDRKGVIVARYRKFNLFIEPGFNVTKEVDLTTFETDFGVTFGTFICFDILFQHPAVDLVRNKVVTHFVYPTAWFSEIPFLTAVQVQAGWASGNGVALLAAGFNSPATCGGGSGVYVKDKVLTDYMPTKRGNKMLIADVPKVLTNIEGKKAKVNNVETEMVYMKEKLNEYTTELLDFSKEKSYSNKLCNNQLCCSFNVEVDSKTDGIFYRAVIFDGYRDFAVATYAYIQVCGIVACKSETLDSCGITNPENIKKTPEFEKITIEGNFTQSDSTLQFPSNLNLDYLPLNGDSYEFSIDTDKSRIVTKKSIKNVLTFAMYSRHFGQDKPIPIPENFEFNIDMLLNTLINNNVKEEL